MSIAGSGPFSSGTRAADPGTGFFGTQRQAALGVAEEVILMTKKGWVVLAAVCLGLAASGVAVAGGNAEAGKEKAGICESCHGPGGRSEDPDNTPTLAGKSEEYLMAALMEFREGKRNPGPMAAICQTLTEEDMADLAAYFASQKP
jgi:cytochrome c553